MNFDFRKINKKRAVIYIAIFLFFLAIILIINSISKPKENSTVTIPPEEKIVVNETQKNQKILFDSALFPALSSDGINLYYQNFNDGFFYKLNITSNKSEKISRELRMVSDIIWSPDRTKTIFVVKQDNHFFEVYNSPFKNPELEDGVFTYWFYDFNQDLLKKISGDILENITWSFDGKDILYHYMKFEENNYTSNLSINNPYETSWKIVMDNVDNFGIVLFNFIDSKNIFLFIKPMGDIFSCNSPKKINIDTRKEDYLISQDTCFQDFFVSPKSRWARYTSAVSSGFINIDTKETFNFDLGSSNILPEDSFSNDGKFFYGFKNGDPNSIYKIDLNAKKVVKIIKTDAPISAAEQVIVSPDEKYIYFLIEQDGLKYLYKTQINS